MTKKFDSLLIQLGMGKWNIIGIALLGYWSINVPAHSLGGTYLTPVLEHSCRIPDDGIPLYKEIENKTVIDTCWYLKNSTSSMERVPCTDWDFDNTTYKTTITSEFKLVCDREYLRPTFQSIYFLGGLIASSIAGLLSDNFGRKTVATVGIIVYSTAANLINWLPSMWSILTARFILGLMHPTTVSVTFTQAMEKNAPRYRAAAGIIGFLPWVLGSFTWAGQAYLIRDWRWLMFVVPLPTLLAIVLLFFVDESPRWLIVKGHHDRALQILRKAARWNKTTLPPDDELRTLMKEIELEANKERSASNEGSAKIIDVVKSIGNEISLLFRTPVMRRITLATYCIFMVSGMVFYGLSLSGSNLGSDPFVYIALSGLMEIPGNTLTLPMVNYLGRKKSTVIGFFLTGVSLLMLLFIPRGGVATTMALIGKMSIAGAYTMMYLYVAELFPTEVRDKGIGSSAMLAKVGTIIVPYLIDTLGSIYWWAPSVVCGGASIVAGGCCFLLPETLNKTLPDTVVEMETTHSSKKRDPATTEKGNNDNTTDNKEEAVPLSAVCEKEP